MMNRDEARHVAQRYLESEMHGSNLELVILDEQTREEEFGWVFFYDSSQYAETGDALYGLVGNAPIIVDAKTGKLHVTGTARPIEHYIEHYRRYGTCNRRP